MMIIDPNKEIQQKRISLKLREKEQINKFFSILFSNKERKSQRDEYNKTFVLWFFWRIFCFSLFLLCLCVCVNVKEERMREGKKPNTNIKEREKVNSRILKFNLYSNVSLSVSLCRMAESQAKGPAVG